MSAYDQSNSIPVIELDNDSRSRFITRTYAHLLAAIAAFTALEILFFATGVAATIAKAMLGTSWLIVLGGFMILSWLARGAAHRATTKGMQYAGLAVYVVGQAILFVPLLYIAERFAPGAIASAAMVTALAFSGLTMVAFITRKDFSFLRGILFWAGIIALVLVIAGSIFGFQLGTFFSVAMVGVAGAAILYDTSNVLHHYPEDRYVAASLELFASVALMLWYVLQLFISRR
jgi:FtsH-binding integral membrane protein